MKTMDNSGSQFELVTGVGEGALERLTSESERQQLDLRIAEIQLSFQQETDWSLNQLEHHQRASGY